MHGLVTQAGTGVAIAASAVVVLYGKLQSINVAQYSGPVSELAIYNSGSGGVYVAVDYQSDSVAVDAVARMFYIASGGTFTLGPNPHGCYGTRVVLRGDGTTATTVNAVVVSRPWCANA